MNLQTLQTTKKCTDFYITIILNYFEIEQKKNLQIMLVCRKNDCKKIISRDLKFFTSDHSMVPGCYVKTLDS